MKKTIIISFTAFLLIWSSCKKGYFVDEGIHNGKINMTTYDFMQSRSDIFDTVLMAIDKAGLKSYYQQQEVTFFTPQNYSIRVALKNVNTFLKTKLISDPSKLVKDSLGYPRDTVLFNDIKPEIWKKMLESYSLKSKRPLASFPFPAEEQVSISGEKTRTFIRAQAWQNVEGAGAKALSYQFFRKSLSIANKIDTIEIRVITSDLQTTNGVLHVLDRQHEFGLSSGRGFIEKN